MLLFPKVKRSRLELIIYLQTQHRRLRAKREAAQRALTVYVRILLPEKPVRKWEKKKTLKKKLSSASSFLGRKLSNVSEKGGDNWDDGIDSIPSSPLSPSVSASPPLLLTRASSSDIGEDDDEDPQPEIEFVIEPRYFYYNTRTGQSFLDPPVLLYDRDPNELRIQGATDKKKSKESSREEAPKLEGNGESAKTTTNDKEPGDGESPESKDVESDDHSDASGTTTPKSPEKKKKKKLTKLEKAAMKEAKRIRAAVVIQSHWRGLISQRRTGRLMLKKRMYIR
jgi:hypothetical protein